MQLDVVFALNRPLDLTLPVVLRSLQRNTLEPKRLRVNVVVPMGERQHFDAVLFSEEWDVFADLRVREFAPQGALADYLLGKYGHESPVRFQGRQMQFARLCIPRIFDDIGPVLYLDTDLVVLRDPLVLLDHATCFDAQVYLAAVPTPRPNWFHFSRPWVARRELRQMQASFNSGVLLSDCRYWDQSLEQRMYRYLHWDASHHYRLFQNGDETLLNLLFKDYMPLDAAWNRNGFGNARLLARCLPCNPEQAAVIHWSGGHHKPWNTPDIPHGEYWHRYRGATPATEMSAIAA